MTLKEQVINELQKLIDNTDNVFEYTIKENDWVNYGKNRTYFKIVKTRKNSKHYAEYDFGYIDNIENKYHAGRHDAFGKYDLYGNER